jgi:hypothetical protein
MTPNTYRDGQIVEAHKALRNGRRWCRATVLYILRTAEHESGEAYMIEFTDGSRGGFDMNHIRPRSANNAA